MYRVSREAEKKLQIYEALLKEWQEKINLISPSTVESIRERHINDSIQLQEYIPEDATIADIGSGAGFPGMVLAILGYRVTLIESDKRKSIFLQEVLRQASIKATIENRRAEEITDKFNVITSRACAPLELLLQLAFPLMQSDATCFFHKGQTYAMEVEDAEKKWCFDYKIYPSKTDSKGVIIALSTLRMT